MQVTMHRHLGDQVVAKAAGLGLLRTAAVMWSKMVADTTQKTYNVGVNRYKGFCVDVGLAIQGRDEFVRPTLHVLVLFVVSLTQEGIQSVTQRVYISAVNSHARAHDIQTCMMPDGTFPPLLAGMLTAARRVYALSPAASAAKGTERLPVTTSMMVSLLDKAQSVLGQCDAARFRCIILMLFLNCLRCGEVLTPTAGEFDPAVHLNSDDVKVDFAGGTFRLLIMVKQAKCDQFRKGRVVVCNNFPGTRFAVIPARTEWLRYRVAICGNNKAGPLFVSANGRPYATAEFRTHLNLVCVAAGLPQARIKPHSFRRGSATVLATHGVEDSALQNFGCWRSNAFRVYVDETDMTRARHQHILTTSSL
jgi:integrase